MNPAPLAEALRQHLRDKSLEYVAASAPSPDAFKRRVYDILHGKTNSVSLRVADEIANVCNHPEWIAVLY